MSNGKTDQVMQKKVETEPDKIETKKLTLVGLEMHMDVKKGFMDEMDELVQRLTSRLGEIEGRDHPDRYVGYWQQVAGERDCGGRMYLAAAEVSAVRNLPEGMVAKAIPENKFWRTVMAQVMGSVDFVTNLRPAEIIANPVRIPAEIRKANNVAAMLTLSWAPKTRIPMTRYGTNVMTEKM